MYYCTVLIGELQLLSIIDSKWRSGRLTRSMGCPGLIPQVDIPLLIIPNQSAPPAASAEQIHNASSACGSGCNCSQLEFLLPDPYEPVYYSLIDDQDISSEMNSLFTVEETNFLLEALFQIGMVCCGYTREKSKRRKVYYAKVLPEICEHTLGSVASVYNTVSFSFTLMCMNFFDFSSIYNSLNFLSSPVRNIVYYFLKTIMLNIWCVLMLDVPYEFVSSWFHFTQITTIGFLLLQGLNVVFFKHTGHYGLPFVTNFGATILYVGILAPILEEYAKHHYMSMPILFGLFEALECKKRHLGPIKWSPVLLHGFVYKLESLNLRIFIHIIWNLSQVLVFLWKDHRNNYETFKHDWVYMKFISVFDLLFLRFHRRLNPPGATPLPASLGAAINLGDDVELVDAIPSFRPDSKFIFDNFTTCKTAIQSFLMDQFIGLYAPFPGIRLKDIERYFTFLLNLCMQSTTTSMITTVMQFASSTSNKLLIEQFKSLLSAFPVPSGWKPESKFKKVSDDIDWLLDTAGSFSGSQMYQWTRAVVTGCLLIPFFNKLNLKFHAKRFGAYDQSFLRSANDNKISFVVDVIRSFKNIIESGVGFITGNGDLNLFKSSTPFSTFFEQADFLYKMQNFLTAGATTKHFLNNEEFRTQLLNTISDGRRIVAATKSCDPGVRTLIARKLAILDDMETKLLVADLAADKDPAMIVVTVGAPGVGKSVFAKMTQQVLEKAYDREFDASAVAVVNPDSKFQDHITNGTRIIHIEELGIETYDALNAKDNTTRMLLYYGDSNPQIVEKSHVDDKGRTLNRNDFVTANTNSFNINVQHITKFPAAVYRRIHWQEIVCKEEFRAEGSLGPDHNKIAAAGVSSLDVYMVREVTFDTTKPVMVFDKRGEPTDIKRGEWMSTDEWSKWLTDKAKTFRDKQKGRRKAYSELMDSRCPHNSWIAICETCKTTAEFKPESRTPVPHLPIEFSSYLFFLYFCKLIFSISSLGALSFFLPLTWFSAHWLNCIAYWLFAFFSKRFFRARYDALWLRLVTNVTTSWDHICDMWIGKISVEKLNDRLVDAANQSSVTMQRLTRTVAFVDMAIAIISCSAGYYILKSVISWFKSYSGTPQGNASSRPAKAEHQTSYESFGSDLAKMGVNTRRMKPTATSAKNVWQEAHSMRAVIEESHMHPPEHLQSVLARQTYKCLLVTDAEESDFNAIAVAPEFLLTNKHNLRPKGRLTISLSMLAEEQQKLCRSYTVDICQDHICDLGGDRALIYVPSLQCKSLLKWMAKDYHKDGWFFSQRSPGFIYDELPRDISVTFGTNENFFGTLMEQVLYYDYEEHRSGLCGAPICFTIGAGTFLYGFHCAGAQDDRCMAVAFTRKDIQRGMDTLKPQRKLAPLVPEGEIKYFDVSGSPPLLGTPDSKSFLNWQSGFVDYVGTVKNLTYTRPRPNMYYLPTAEFAENFGVDTKNSDGNYKWGIPVFKEFPDATEDLGYYSPYHKWASKSFQSSDYCDYEAVTSAMEEFWENIENADVDWDVRPMDIDSVCAGDNQVHTVRSMNAKTSMGFGFKGKKSDYMYENCTDQAPDGKMLSDDILSSVMEDIKTYASGKTVCPISKASLKVEARVRQPSGDEFKTKQPRVFCATPISDVVIGRMFLLPLLDIMKQDRKHFECAVGLNAMSPQWGTLRDIFEEKDVINKTFGTDISGFDTRMPLLVKHAAMTILIRMAIKCGWSSEEIAIITGYLTDGLYPYVLVKNDILLMPNIIISGRVGTAEFNSLCLSIIYRMVWNKLRVKIQPDLKFNDNVALITYGDDSKAGSLADWFNQRNFCLGCAYFGIHATTVSKSEDFEQFVPFDGEEFLHRIWRWDEEYQVWCAPLAFDSMVRSLVLNNTSPIGPDVQCFEAAHSINFELAQHGREVFNEKMPKLYGILLDAGIIGRVGEPTFKSFEEIMERCYR